MNNSLLPFAVQQFAVIVIFALSIFMVAVHSVLFMRAVQQTASPRGAQWVAPLTVGAALAVWLGTGVSMTAGGKLPLVRNDEAPGLHLLVGFGPVVAASALLFLSKAVSSVYGAMPPEWLIRVQIYRVAGLMFLYPFLYYGVIPLAFAVPAAVGDFLTGLFAPVVGSAVARRKPGAFAWAVAWNLFGILDLIVAPAAAFLSHARVFQIYPLTLVALFLGPPLGILTHIYSLRNLSIRRHANPADAYRRATGSREPLLKAGKALSTT